MSEILDSGERREFDTGAVRDMREGQGKGRCDLLPLAEVAVFLNDRVLCEIASFYQTGEVLYLYNAVKHFVSVRFESQADAMLELAVHYEDGLQKYPAHNWEKGIPCSSYVDSGVRHYLKWLAGVEDERHDRAFMWNMFGCIWTKNNLPEMDDIPHKIYTPEEKPTSKTYLEDFMAKHPCNIEEMVIRYECVGDLYGDHALPSRKCMHDCAECWVRNMPDTSCIKDSRED